MVYRRMSFAAAHLQAFAMIREAERVEASQRGLEGAMEAQALFR